MSDHRRGTKYNPFDVGEEVHILSKDKRGVVKRVVHSGRPRSWIKYEVEYRWLGGLVTEQFGIAQLDSIDKSKG